MIEQFPCIPQNIIAEKTSGCLLGTAVGDALGLPFEGLKRKRIKRLFKDTQLRHNFFFNRGMISDDTEHACMTAQALLTSGGDIDKFTRSLAWRLRGWLLGIPVSIGWATLKAIVKLWLGWSPKRSGVRSAGNGAAMRAAIIGVYAYRDSEKLHKLSLASTRLTHIEPRAEQGALLIATSAAYGLRHGPVKDPASLFARLRLLISDNDLLAKIDLMENYLRCGATPDEFADALGLSRGVTGYINHTAPVAIFCWLRFPENFRMAIEEVIRLGGDTDSTAAIVGGLMGATLGMHAIPREWLNNLIEWPRSVRWICRLGNELAESSVQYGPVNRKDISLFWPGLLARNILFTLVVLWHALRRLFPPY